MKFKKTYAFLIAGLLCVATGVGIYNAGPSVEPVKAAAGDSYTLVTTLEDVDVAGTYVVASIDSKVIATGNKNGTTINYTNVDISNNSLQLPAGSTNANTPSEFSLIANSNGSYKIFTETTDSGYIVWTSGNSANISNNESDSDMIITVDDSDGAYIRSNKDQDRILRYNPGTGFRFYASNTGTIARLFKKVEISSTDVLESIKYSGQPVTQYIGKPFDPTGLTFVGTYSESGEKEIPSGILTFAPSVMSEDTTEVTASYGDISVTITGFDVIYNPYTYFGEHEDFGSWETSYDVHILQYEQFTVTFSAHNKQTGTITNAPVSKAGSVTITLDSSISKSHTITYVEFGFIQWTTKTQNITLNGGNNDEVKLSFPSGGTTISDTYTGHVTEVVAKATNSDNQIGWEYVLVTIEELEVDPAVEFANRIINELTCINNPEDRGEDYLTNLSSEWLTLKSAFELLDEETKLVFTNGTSEDETIKAALAKYDLILRNYGSDDVSFPNFMNREVTQNINIVPNGLFNQTNNIIIIVSVCLLSLTTIAVFMVIYKKRKEIKK